MLDLVGIEHIGKYLIHGCVKDDVAVSHWLNTM